MPFDPTLPATNSPILSAELRNQFNALKALIDVAAAPEPYTIIKAGRIDVSGGEASVEITDVVPVWNDPNISLGLSVVGNGAFYDQGGFLVGGDMADGGAGVVLLTVNLFDRAGNPVNGQVFYQIIRHNA